MKSRLHVVVMILAGITGALNAKVLDSLALEGLVVNQPSIVINSIDLHKGKDFTSADVQESIKKLYRLGIFSAVDFFVDKETDSTISLILKVKEFSLCEGIEYSGQKKLKEKDLEEKVKVKRGQVVTDAILFKSRIAIEDVYADKGYLLADVKADLVPTKVPGNVIVKFTIKEGPKVHIKNVTFQGNKDIKSSKLSSKFKTKTAKWWRSGDFNEELYKSHLDSLVMFYNDLGYLDAAVIKDSVWYSETKKDINVDITVYEGKKYYAGNFFFNGNKILETDSLGQKIALKKGKPFQKSRFDMSKYSVESAYREEGFLWVQVNDKKAYRGDTIDVTFDIDEGRPAIVRKIDIKGNAKTMEKVVRRNIDLIPGQKYKQSLMARSQQNIYQLNYFSNVTPDMTPNDDGTIDLVFNVTEKDNVGQLSVGAAFSQVDGFVGTFSTSIPNFRGAGQKLDLNLEYGLNRQNVAVQFTEPYAFDRPIFTAASVFANKTKYTNYSDDYSTERYGFSLTSGLSKMKWPDDHLTLSGTYQFSYESSTRPAEILPGLRLLQSGIMSSLSARIVRYDLDMPMFPTTGSQITVIPEIAGLGGDFKYLKGTAQYEQYFQLPLKLVLGSKIQLGVIQGLPGQDVSILSTDLFRLGGVYGDGYLRGYPEYSIGSYRNSLEGMTMFNQNIELRYPILDQQLYVAAFADLGNTWNSLADVNLANLYKGVGAGLRVNIPMLGMMGFDFAYGFDDVSGTIGTHKPSGFQFHFLMNKGF